MRGARRETRLSETQDAIKRDAKREMLDANENGEGRENALFDRVSPNRPLASCQVSNIGSPRC